MAVNKPIGDDRRIGAVRQRSQVLNPKNKHWTKRNRQTGEFMDQRAQPHPKRFKGVRREKVN
jgi:hypothetical protein